MAINWFKYSSPQAFLPLAGRMIPWFSVAALASICVGLYIGFFVAPTDFQQGDSYRIIFVHVPAAWMSMFLYVVMAIWAGLGLGLNARPSFMMAQAIAPTGAAHRCDVGQTDLGCLVGVGRSADVGTDSVVSVYRNYLVARVD